MMEAIRRKFADEPTVEELVREAAQRLAEQKIDFLKSQPGIAATYDRIKARWAKAEAVNRRHAEALEEDRERALKQGPRRIAPIPIPMPRKDSSR